MNHTFKRPHLYPKQKDFVDCDARYTIVEASTKTGKTMACLIWLMEQAMMGKAGMNYWWVAPVYSQARIAFDRLKIRISKKSVFEANESRLFIKLCNGAVIQFKSAEKPDNLYGDEVWATVIDEATRCKHDAWVAIKTTMTKTQGKMKIIGNVKGKNNWVYRMAREAEAGKEGFAYHKLTIEDAVEAGIISVDAIEDARQTLPEQMFRELYYAEPFENINNPFAYSFDEEKNVGNVQIMEHQPIYLSFDFNVEPITCLAIQFDKTNKKISVVKEFRLLNSNIKALCENIIKVLGKHNYYITGDASGQNRSALSDLNYYGVIKKELGILSNKFKLPGANPSVKNSRVLLNSILQNYSGFKISDKCKFLIEDLKYVEVDEEGNINKNKDKHRSHLLDCLRYYLNYFHNDFIIKYANYL